MATTSRLTELSETSEVIGIIPTSKETPNSVVDSTIKAASLLAAGKAAATGAISAQVAALTEGVMKTMLFTKLKATITVVLVLGFVAAMTTVLTCRTTAGQQEKPAVAEKQDFVGGETPPPKTEARPAAGGTKWDAPVPDAWSGPVNGLCGRLRIIFAEEHIPASNRGGVITAEQTLVWLDSQVELKNDSAKPLAVPNHFLLEAKVFDAAGKEIKDRQPLPSSAAIIPLAWRKVPVGGSLSGYVSLPAYLSRNGSVVPLESYRSRAKGDGTVPLFLGEREWLLKPGRYRAKATLTVEKAKSSPSDAWSGRLELPPVEFTVTPEQVGLPSPGSRQGAQAAKGLELTLSADKTETRMQPDGKNAVPVNLKLTFTNNTDRPIKLDAYVLQWRMGFRCDGPTADSVKRNVEYIRRPANFLPTPVAEESPVLQPGKSWSPEWTRSFPGGIADGFDKGFDYALRTPGTYKLRVTLYENLIAGDEPQAKRTVCLESNELELTVREKDDGKVREKKEASPSPDNGQPSKTTTGLKEGVWIFQGPRNILGVASDTFVTLEKKQANWLISYRHIQHFSVNDNKPPQETVVGPYEITVAGPALEYQGPDGVEKITYRFDGDSLVMPAVVRLDERTWMMQTTSALYDPAKKAKTTRSEKYVWRCQSDPTKIDQGEAEFPPFGKQEGGSKGQYTYIFSQEKDKAGRTISLLRFLNASKDMKDATESCRLTWDAEGAIQIEARSLPPDWHQRKYSPKEPARLKVKEECLRDELIQRMKEDQDCRALTWKLLSNRNDTDLQDVDWDALVKDHDPDPESDAQMKAALEKGGKTKWSDATLAAWKKETRIDRANTARMKEIIERFGWPGKSLVGTEAADAAWLLVQHADLDRPFQKRCLGLIDKAVKDGEAEAKHFAYLTDRVLIAEEKKQLYGTQLVEENGKLKPKPIEDEPNVDKRRQEGGLEPLADYLRLAQQFYFPHSTSMP